MNLTDPISILKGVGKHRYNTFIKNGDSKHLSEDGKWKDGMWSREVVFPYTKNYEAVANGHLYKKAIKIF